MRWWMITYPPRAAAIENANVIGMDYTVLPSNTSMVQWTDGRGEIEYNDRPRLREVFYDMTPYVPLLQQFMTRLTGITLKQAKTVQAQLISELYDNHRQLPFNYTVGAGTYDWESTDAAVAAMAATGLPALFDITAGSSAGASLIEDINGIIDNINTVLIPEINANDSGIAGGVNANVVSPAGALVSYINNTVLGDIGAPSSNTLNARLQPSAAGLPGGGSGSIQVASPGLNGNIAQTGIGFTSVTAATIAPSLIHLSPPGSLPSIQWLPSGGTAMVTLSLAELMAIMKGIAARRTTLTITQNTKLNEVAALTSVADVIAYDPTTGW